MYFLQYIMHKFNFSGFDFYFAWMKNICTIEIDFVRCDHFWETFEWHSIFEMLNWHFGKISIDNYIYSKLPIEKLTTASQGVPYDDKTPSIDFLWVFCHPGVRNSKAKININQI